jgi:methylamine dehydrogenase accessory protein MauD
MTKALVISQIMQWILLAALVVTVLALARQIGLLHRRLPPPPAKPLLQGPRLNAPAPRHNGVDVRGRPVVIPARGMRTLLIFVSPRCTTCEGVLPAVQTIARSERGRTETLLVSLASEASTVDFVNKQRLRLPVIASEELGDVYNVSATPYAFLIDENGILRFGALVNHLEHLESVLETVWDASPREAALAGRDER